QHKFSCVPHPQGDVTVTDSLRQGIEFKLFAPYNEEVALLGSWNNRQRIPMSKDEKGWWHTWLPLSDGEYTYRFGLKSKSYFMVDQWVEVADPRAARLTMEFPEAACLTVENGQR